MQVRYSFLLPQKKSIFSPLTKAWFFYIFLSLVVLAFLWVVFEVQTDRFIQNANELDKKIEQEKIQNQDLQKQLGVLNHRLEKLQQISEENKGIVEGLNNLFNLVPEQITINSLDLTPSGLHLKGITPSKELYSFLLETPLKAIFSESRAEFYVLPSGWFNFISVSKILNYGNKQAKKDPK